jgi:hypothetical protein
LLSFMFPLNEPYTDPWSTYYQWMFGTNLVRPRERSAGKWGIGGTSDAELE